MMNDELKTKKEKEKERTILFQTSRYFEDFLVAAHGRASFFDLKHRLSWRRFCPSFKDHVILKIFS